MPLDGMPFFVERTWGVIREQKELNLPGQREMVANYRCGEIKDEAFLKVKQEIETLTAKSDVAIVE